MRTQEIAAMSTDTPKKQLDAAELTVLDAALHDQVSGGTPALILADFQAARILKLGIPAVKTVPTAISRPIAVTGAGVTRGF
jgi:hypothetical protein